MPKKYALAPCNGMSPNGLVSHVATGDCKKEIKLPRLVEVVDFVEFSTKSTSLIDRDI